MATWATISEFQNWLTASGMFSSPPNEQQSYMDLNQALSAATQRINDLTRYWPFLSNGNTAEVRYFEPPHNGIVDLNGGLVTFTSMAYAVSYDGTSSYTSGTSETNLRDFRLMPHDADKQVKPWTYIDCCLALYGDVVAVTGEWGYYKPSTLTEDARILHMMLAARTLAPSIDLARRGGGLKKLTRGDETKEWGDFGALGKMLDEQIEQTIRAQGYRRVVI